MKTVTFFLLFYVAVSKSIQKTRIGLPNADVKNNTAGIHKIQAQDIAFRCFKNGTVEINKDSFNGYHIFNVSGTNDTSNGNPMCSTGLKSVVGNTENVTLIGCDVAKPILVKLSNTPKDRDDLEGGHNFHEYSLSCDFPTGGKVINLTKSIAVNLPPSPTTKAGGYEITLDMSFKPHTNVHLGDTLTLTISEGSSDYYILPTSCTANDGTPSSPKTLELIKDGTTQDAEIMKNFDVSTTKGQATAIVYAFEFVSSKTVVFECSVTVCKENDANCSAHSFYSSTNTKRRRRATKEEQNKNSYEVSAAYQIANQELDNTSSGQEQVGFSPTLLVSSLVSFITLMFRLD